ncbi:MAG TPA: metal ABC transporter ATP-binding protein [Acidimicrobiales bacterium]|nr:metal ABC transporter ATP-binding protein [Acidimicrobiales bacterium]
MSAATPTIEAVNVTFSYGATGVLRDVSFRVGCGEFVALAGPNGSGKSTLLRILLGLLEPTSGSVRLLGQAPGDVSERWRIGYVPQRVAIPDDMPATVAEVVASGRLSRGRWWRPPRRADREAVDHALESVEVADLRTRRMRELSGGQQQRVLIAKAFVSEPDVLILDEPVAGVDAGSQRRFRDALVHLVDEHGASVFLVSHEFGAVADDLDRVLVLQHGRIVFDGGPDELVRTGVSLGVHEHDLPLWLEGLADAVDGGEAGHPATDRPGPA